MAYYSYVLIDGVLWQNAIKELYEQGEAIQLMPLYIGTRFEENYDLGPLLVSVLEGSHFISKAQSQWQERASILYSNHPPAEIANHLRKFITVTDETNSNGLFRFADPLVTWYWLNSYTESALTDMLGPINQWIVAKPRYEWEAQKEEHSLFKANPTQPPLGLTLNYLNMPQIDALEAAAEFRVRNEIYQTCHEIAPNYFANQTPSTITQWVVNRFIQAKEFGVINESTYAMWFVMTMEYGNNFVTDPTENYQQWLAANAQHKPLPADIKLQKFFDERPPIEITKVMEI